MDIANHLYSGLKHNFKYLKHNFTSLTGGKEFVGQEFRKDSARCLVCGSPSLSWGKELKDAPSVWLPHLKVWCLGVHQSVCLSLLLLVLFL